MCLHSIKLYKCSVLELTLVLNELVEETGFPRPSTANHQELKQEVCKHKKGGRDQCNANINGEPAALCTSILRDNPSS